MASRLAGALGRPLLAVHRTNCFSKFVQKVPAAAMSSGSPTDLKDSYDVAIIGGGCIGASLAYHLMDHKENVVLLERTELTAGSTWHAAGLATYFNPGMNVKKIHHYSMELYKGLEAETGQDVGLHQCGSLRLASTQERWQEALYHQARHGWHEAKQWLVTPEEIAEMWPIMNMEGILGGLYNPGDGHIDPYSLTQALATGARTKGAKIAQNTPVTATTQLPDGTWKVETPTGDLHANVLINAAGFWAREVGRMAGVDVPLVPIHHQYVIFRPQDEVKNLAEEPPVLRDLEASTYIRLERGGLLAGPYEDQAVMELCDDWYDNGPPPGFGKELFQPGIERIALNIERCMKHLPILEEAEVSTVVSGPITYSPDVLPLVGALYPLKNYYITAGFSYGIIHAGGVGKYISDWIKLGEPPYDLAELDPNRYSNYANRDYVLRKCRESYGMNNAIAFPREERPGGRPTRPVTPLYDIQKESGAQFGFSAGYESPKWFSLPGDEAGYKPSFTRTNWFEPVQREARGVLQNVGITDASPFGKYIISGPDAEAFVDYMYANRVPKEGRTVISHMLTPLGRVYAEHTVTKLKEPLPGSQTQGFLAVTGGSVEHHDLRWMEKHAFEKHMDVKFEIVSHEYLAIGVAGPRAGDFLSTLTSADLSAEAFPFMSSRNIEVAGVPCLAVAISYTGELGWELYCQHTDKLYRELLNHGKQFDLVQFGSYAMDALRIEKGFNMWGKEMSMDNGPLDTGLIHFVKFDKDRDFIGADAVREAVTRGPQRKVAHLQVMTSHSDPEGAETVWNGDQVVGHVSSGCFGPSAHVSLAMADIPVELASAGTMLQVEILGERHPARVLPGPPSVTHPVRERRRKRQQQQQQQ